jgi:hypothetical protein
VPTCLAWSRSLSVFRTSRSTRRRKHWLKFVPIDEMTAEGRRRLAKVNEQEDGLWQLHLQRNKWRIWGYFEEPEFSFLWWDSDHGVAIGKSHRRRSS